VLRVAGGPVTKIPVQQNYRWYNKFTVGLQVGGSWPPGASSSWSFVLSLGWCARIFQTMASMVDRWCPCRGGQSDRWRTDGTGGTVHRGCIAVYAGYTPGYTPLVSGMRAISMEKLRRIPARAATESTEQPEMTASGAETRSDRLGQTDTGTHSVCRGLAIVLRQGGLRAGLPTVVAGVCVCAFRQTDYWRPAPGEATRLGRATRAMRAIRTPQLLQGDTFPHIQHARALSTQSTQPFYSCGLAVHLSNDPYSP